MGLFSLLEFVGPTMNSPIKRGEPSVFPARFLKPSYVTVLTHTKQGERSTSAEENPRDMARETRRNPFRKLSQKNICFRTQLWTSCICRIPDPPVHQEDKM